jgi:hypothetical protein
VVLLAQAAHVTVISISKEKGTHTIDHLQADIAAALSAAPPGTAVPMNGTIASDTLDAHNLVSVRVLCACVGEVDHFVWTSGDPLHMGFPQHLSLDKNREFLPLSYRTYSSFVSLTRADWIVSTLHPPPQATGLLPAKGYKTLMKPNINELYLMSGDSLVSLSFLFWALCLTC